MLVTGRTWKGSAFGGFKSRSQVPGLVEDSISGKIKIDDFVSGHESLNNINRAFELMEQGKSIRTIIDLHV